MIWMNVLGDILNKLIFVYFDEILIFSHSETKHVNNVKAILQRLLPNLTLYYGPLYLYPLWVFFSITLFFPPLFRACPFWSFGCYFVFFLLCLSLPLWQHPSTTWRAPNWHPPSCYLRLQFAESSWFPPSSKILHTSILTHNVSGQSSEQIILSVIIILTWIFFRS